MLKITPTRENERSFKVRLCGQLTKEYLPEIERLLANDDAKSQSISLNLANVTFVDPHPTIAQRERVNSPREMNPALASWVHYALTPLCGFGKLRASPSPRGGDK